MGMSLNSSRGRGGRRRAPMAEINVTPFVDVMLVLLIIFMVTAPLLASIWVWTIVVSFWLRMGRVRARSSAFEQDFWDADQPEALVSGKRRQDNPSARVAAAGLAELRTSTKDGMRDKAGAKARIALAMEGQVAAEADALAERLNFLATTGAVAPFVGLFGTVWGIMNSFFQIGMQQNSSLAVVAPGISEALFATAIGLFAAIPATIAYNRFSHRVNAFEARLQRFADKVHAQVGRELERT